MSSRSATIARRRASQSGGAAADDLSAEVEGVKGKATWLPLVLLCGTGALLGSIFSLGKVATAAGVPPLAYAFWMALGGGLLLLVISSAIGKAPKATPRYLRYYAVSGLVSLALPNGILLMAIPHVGAGMASVAYALPAAFTYAFATVAGMERKSLRRFAGIALGLTGTLALILPRATLPGDAQLGWLLFELLIPVVIAIGNIYRTVAWPSEAHPVSLAAGMLLSAALWTLPMLFVFDQVYLPWRTFDVGTLVVVAQMLVSAAMFILYFMLQRVAGPVYFSQLGYVTTVVGLFSGAVFFGESYGAWALPAIAVIFSGIALVNARR